MAKTLADYLDTHIACGSCSKPSRQLFIGLVDDGGFVCPHCSARNDTDKETIASYKRMLDIARQLAPASTTPL